MLYKAMEGRNARVENCLKQCGEVFSKSKEAYHGLKQKTHKENMQKAKFKEFNREEFHQQFLSGMDPVLNGWDYYDCKINCRYP